MVKHIKVNSMSTAWEVAASIFPTDYQKDEESSKRAGYPIYKTTSTDESFRIPHFRPKHPIRGKHGSRNGDDLGRGKRGGHL